MSHDLVKTCEEKSLRTLQLIARGKTITIGYPKLNQINKCCSCNISNMYLVITDFAMPLVSGIGLISLLKKQSPETPIIAMTGWGKHPQELATEVDADTILMKPFDLEELDQSMDKLLVHTGR